MIYVEGLDTAEKYDAEVDRLSREWDGSTWFDEDGDVTRVLMLGCDGAVIVPADTERVKMLVKANRDVVADVRAAGLPVERIGRGSDEYCDIVLDVEYGWTWQRYPGPFEE